jgi:hypothetical protein
VARASSSQASELRIGSPRYDLAREKFHWDLVGSLVFRQALPLDFQPLALCLQTFLRTIRPAERIQIRHELAQEAKIRLICGSPQQALRHRPVKQRDPRRQPSEHFPITFLIELPPLEQLGDFPHLPLMKPVAITAFLPLGKILLPHRVPAEKLGHPIFYFRQRIQPGDKDLALLASAQPFIQLFPHCHRQPGYFAFSSHDVEKI